MAWWARARHLGELLPQGNTCLWTQHLASCTGEVRDSKSSISNSACLLHNREHLFSLNLIISRIFTENPAKDKYNKYAIPAFQVPERRQGDQSRMSIKRNSEHMNELKFTGRTIDAGVKPSGLIPGACHPSCTCRSFWKKCQQLLWSRCSSFALRRKEREIRKRYEYLQIFIYYYYGRLPRGVPMH